MAKEKESSPESVVKKIKRNTRRKFGAEEKIRIVLEGVRLQTIRTRLGQFLNYRSASMC